MSLAQGGHGEAFWGVKSPLEPLSPAAPGRQCIAFEFIVKAHLVWHGFNL